MRHLVLLTTAVLAGLVTLAARRAPNQTREQWEYRTVWNEKDTTKLNVLGHDGWELVAVTTASFGGTTAKEVGWAYFKRRVATP